MGKRKVVTAGEGRNRKRDGWMIDQARRMGYEGRYSYDVVDWEVR